MFEREIWPKLRSLQVIALVRATGLSYGYCNQIKLGHKTPHPRWWEVLPRRVECSNLLGRSAVNPLVVAVQVEQHHRLLLELVPLNSYDVVLADLAH